jgi:predicted dehydrogenase
VTQALTEPAAPRTRTPRLGFLGVGWIGRHRMKAVADAGEAEIAALSDPSSDALAAAGADAPRALRASSYEELLDQDLDGIVIATPSALHAEQAVAALSRGMPVFCQKPLARTAAETRRVIDAARRADRLLGVDFSYRFTDGFTKILDLIRAGELGDLYAIDLTFHNAYGPDKAWFKDPALSGGGCVIDLGVHLVDLALLALGHPRVESVSGRLFAGGKPLHDPATQVEDYAVAQFVTASGAAVRLACSWWLSAGQDAVIDATFHGSKGGASLRNVNGSFFDFRAERYRGTQREVLAAPPDAWGGRAIVAWARRLAHTPTFDPAIESAADAAAVLDRIYDR